MSDIDTNWKESNILKLNNSGQSDPKFAKRLEKLIKLSEKNERAEMYMRRRSEQDSTSSPSTLSTSSTRIPPSRAALMSTPARDNATSNPVRDDSTSSPGFFRGGSPIHSPSRTPNYNPISMHTADSFDQSPNHVDMGGGGH